MTLYRRHDGEILERDDYERKTYYLVDGGLIDEEDIEHVFECDHCGEIKEYSEVVPLGAGMTGHVCREHVPDELLEAVKGEKDE